MSSDSILVNVTTKHINEAMSLRPFTFTRNPLALALYDMGYRNVRASTVLVFINDMEYELDEASVAWMERYMRQEPVEPIVMTIRATGTVLEKHLSSLREAQSHLDGVVYIQDADTTLYVVTPAIRVRASEAVLKQLGADLVRIYWNEPIVSHFWGAVRYARVPMGNRVHGRSKSVIVTSEIWVVPKLVETGVSVNLIWPKSIDTPQLTLGRAPRFR